jgi:hypothetical protein
MKRALLTVITLLSLVPFVLSLVHSLGELQVQPELELAQTNLVLEAMAGPAESDLKQQLPSWMLTETSYPAALAQYEKSLTELQVYHQQLAALSNPSDTTTANAAQAQQRQKSLQQNEKSQQSIHLRLGLLEAVQGQRDSAQDHWQAVIRQNPSSSVAETAQALQQLWSDPPLVPPQAETLLTSQLSGWFQRQALQRLYELEQRPKAQQALTEQTQQAARQALLKLALLSALPLAGGLLGVLLALGLLVQWFLKKEQAILAHNAHQSWETPWDWQIIWQVLAVGFLFLGQVALPLGFSLLHLNSEGLGLREKALFVLVSYLALALGGLAVLYFSLRPYQPWPADWFTVQFSGRALLWGLGGYCVALPLVVLVSLVNQQIWQGQGGSNPLLTLALQAQDKWALVIFFITASILAPIFEEIMFRGFLLPSLTRYIPVSGAIVVSSFVFAVAHLNLSEVLPLAVLGALLGLVYSRSRNLLASITLHSLWNSGTLLSLFILGSSGSLSS